MAPPKPLPLGARRASWDRVWKVLLTAPTVQNATERPSTDDKRSDREAANKAA